MADMIRVTVYAEQAITEAKTISRPERVTIAHEIAAEAQAHAPVLTGRFRDGIGVVEDADTVSVVDNDPTAGYKEYGTAHTPAHATLTATAAEFGRYSGVQPRDAASRGQIRAAGHRAVIARRAAPRRGRPR